MASVHKVHSPFLRYNLRLLRQLKTSVFDKILVFKCDLKSEKSMTVKVGINVLI